MALRVARRYHLLVRHSLPNCHWLALLLMLVLPSAALVDGERCSREGNYIVVDTNTRDLFLCSGTTVVEKFSVSLGRGGVGEHAHGANRTPVGAFGLADPRPSQKFGTFISFLGAWGIHGPARNFKWAGGLNTMVDWTQGCVATGTDAEIERIANWIRKEKVRRIFIGPDGKPPAKKSPAGAEKAPSARSPKKK